jgi:hypothetical protein
MIIILFIIIIIINLFIINIPKSSTVTILLNNISVV